MEAVDFPVFEHARWLAQASQGGAPRHNLGASGFVLEDPLAGLPRDLDAADVAGLDMHAGTAYRSAVAKHLGLPDDAVRPTSGTSGANLAAIAHFVRPGCNVVCERPYYAPMPHMAQGLGARVRFVDRASDGALDPHDVEAAMDRKTALVLLASPNNPTGHAMDQDGLRHLGEAAQRSGAYVLVDQVFAELTGHAKAAGLHPHLLSTGGFNKCWGAPGLRAGWIAGEAGTLDAIEDVHRLLVAAPSPGGTRLATALLEQAPQRQEMLAQRVRSNQRVLTTWLDEHGMAAPHGELVAFLPAPAPSQAFAARLLADGILTVPGPMFGVDGAVRIGLGIPTAALAAGLSALGPHLA